jgi:hypothetical protein
MKQNDEISAIDNGSLCPLFVRKRVFIINSDKGRKEGARREKIWVVYENPINKLKEIGDLFLSDAFDFSIGMFFEESLDKADAILFE